MPATTPAIFPSGPPEFSKFPSRRSVVHSTKGIVACTQPLAAKCGIDILEAGGNCVDAAVAVAAGLNMTEPCSTGIGGDVFCLYYDAQTRKVSALNGSGRSGAKYTLETIRSALGLKEGQKGKIPMDSVQAATVPGAPAGWCDAVERFGSGKISMEKILAPAIELGEKGFPVSESCAHYWGESEHLLRKASPNFAEMLKKDPQAPDGCRAPRAGEIMKNPNMSKTFRTLATQGKKGFYTGRIAEELVKVVQDLGGHLTLDDLAHHLEVGSEPVDPISLKFRGHGVPERMRDQVVGKDVKDLGLELWEHPPNGQGIVALMALGIIQELESLGRTPTFSPADFNTAPYLHAIIESLRIAFADASWYVTDTDTSVGPGVPTSGLLKPEYLRDRASQLFDPNQATAHKALHGSPAFSSSDTVYFSVSDPEGNAVSFINSNYGGFGTSIVPKGCGFTLQNRGANFDVNDPKHPNVVGPRKRPYHTIIPGAVTNLHDGSLHSVFGVMGGFMQPQGHVQTLLGQAVCGLSPQEALDAPRVCIGAGMPENQEDGKAEMIDVTVYCEEGMPEGTVDGLRKLGHEVQVVKGLKRGLFGRGQIIRWSVDPLEEGMGVWSAGSDMRGDGGAYPL